MLQSVGDGVAARIASQSVTPSPCLPLFALVWSPRWCENPATSSTNSCFDRGRGYCTNCISISNSVPLIPVELFYCINYGNNVLYRSLCLHIMNCIEDKSAIPGENFTPFQHLLADLLRGTKRK